ncbi:hypothetical protein AWC17_19515 [Mycobacterium nebraskense]|uniref:Lipoprotein LpqS n=2 Tax=Mycobacteriaceae TaxID=1762 RepID=A0A1X1YU68_9MYCO|nr:hypothetical protein [Mycobacterium avium subsp. hominissuis]MCA2310841.1 hypothetical protein [Mycobacterium intracellulare subsp. chimaera]MCA2353483.1 hypothetical protein [Mycobacterium intracellulare subsp. chimaera]MCV7121039.1 hypothetical protein [Mycobacterium nebraskense]ORW14580.1 hypothetical protein AWC17_19515 [Mycobacterium nebraskense]
MRFGSGSGPRLRCVVAVCLAVWGVLIGADSVIMNSQALAVHPAPAVSSASGGGQPALSVDHPHLGKGSPSEHPEQFTTAVLPRSGAAVAMLIVLGVVAAVAVAGGLGLLGVPAGRGPPGAPAFALTGQEVLTRFCLSRR